MTIFNDLVFQTITNFLPNKESVYLTRLEKYYQSKKKYVELNDSIIYSNIPKTYEFKIRNMNVVKNGKEIVFPKYTTHLTITPVVYDNKIIIPDSVTNLTIICGFEKDSINLPNSLTSLVFGNAYNQLTYDKYNIFTNNPNSLTTLVFGNNYNQPTNNLPDSLTSLVFGDSYNQPTNNLPNSITTLIFGVHYNQPTNNIQIR